MRQWLGLSDESLLLDEQLLVCLSVFDYRHVHLIVLSLDSQDLVQFLCFIGKGTNLLDDVQSYDLPNTSTLKVSNMNLDEPDVSYRMTLDKLMNLLILQPSQWVKGMQ